MLTTREATEIIVDTVEYSRTHEHYKRVTDYADRLKRLITGEGIDKELAQIVSRETPKDFELRKKLLFPVVPAACSKARVPFYQVARTQGYKGSIGYEGDKDGGKNALDDLQTALDNFYGDESLNDYMNDRFVDLNRIDPNSFVMVTFDAFDNTEAKAQPYPVEVTSHEAVNIGYKRNAVEWMVGKFGHKYKNAKGDRIDGVRFILWYGDAIEFRQVDHSAQYPKVSAKDEVSIDQLAAQLERPPTAPGSDEPQQAVRIVIGNRAFECSRYEPFTGDQKKEFPGIQVGHVKDPFTGGRTFLSSLHPGLNRMLESLKVGSEQSLTMALTCHPQIFMYLPACKGEPQHPCSKGVDMATGEVCKVCGGSGKELPTSVLDAMIFDLPKDAQAEDVLDLAKLKHYSAPDTAIIDTLINYVALLEDNILRDIFTSQQHERGTVTRTATESVIDADAMNNTVYPYALKRATVWIKLVRLCAAFVEADKNLQVDHPVPENLRLAPVSELMNELRAAKEAGANPVIIDAIEDEIVMKELRDRPDEFKQYLVKKKFRPYRTLPPDMQQSLIVGGQGSPRDRVMVVYETEVYREAVRKNAKFYDLAEEAQEAILSEIVEGIIAREQLEQPGFDDEEEDPNNPTPPKQEEEEETDED